MKSSLKVSSSPVTQGEEGCFLHGELDYTEFSPWEMQVYEPPPD